MSLIDSVNVGSYHLLKNNCADFISKAVNSLGWQNADITLLPEYYVRDVYIANIREFKHVKGIFKRDGIIWKEYVGNSMIHSFDETGHDSSWIFIKDNSRQLEIRIPLKGGFCQWRVTGDWRNLYNVVPLID